MGQVYRLSGVSSQMNWWLARAVSPKRVFPAQTDADKHVSGIRVVVERVIAHLKNWKILATGYRRPLRKFE